MGAKLKELDNHLSWHLATPTGLPSWPLPNRLSAWSTHRVFQFRIPLWFFSKCFARSTSIRLP